MTQPPDRRFDLRAPTDQRALVLGAGVELPCRILDRSAGGMKIRLDRPNSLPRAVVVIDLARGLATEAEVAWTKGVESGLKARGETALTGLVPSRLLAARDAWRRAGGR